MNSDRWNIFSYLKQCVCDLIDNGVEEGIWIFKTQFLSFSSHLLSHLFTP